MKLVRKIKSIKFSQYKCTRCGATRLNPTASELDGSKSYTKVDPSKPDIIDIGTGNADPESDNSPLTDDELQVFINTSGNNEIEALCFMGEETFKRDYISLSAKDHLINSIIIASQEAPEYGSITLEAANGARQLGLGMDRDKNDAPYLYITENGKRVKIEEISFIENGISFTTESGSKLTILSKIYKNNETTVIPTETDEIKIEKIITPPNTAEPEKTGITDIDIVFDTKATPNIIPVDDIKEMEDEAPRILPFKDPEPEEINGFKDIPVINFVDIIIQCDGQSINNKEHFCFTHRTIEPHEDRSLEFSDGRTAMGCFKCEAHSWRRTIRYINEPSWYAD